MFNDLLSFSKWIYVENNFDNFILNLSFFSAKLKIFEDTINFLDCIENNTTVSNLNYNYRDLLFLSQFLYFKFDITKESIFIDNSNLDTVCLYSLKYTLYNDLYCDYNKLLYDNSLDIVNIENVDLKGIKNSVNMIFKNFNSLKDNIFMAKYLVDELKIFSSKRVYNIKTGKCSYIDYEYRKFIPISYMKMLSKLEFSFGKSNNSEREIIVLSNEYEKITENLNYYIVDSLNIIFENIKRIDNFFILTEKITT